MAGDCIQYNLRPFSYAMKRTAGMMKEKADVTGYCFCGKRKEKIFSEKRSYFIENKYLF